jgi:Mg-chelatase subunit ChlD
MRTTSNHTPAADRGVSELVGVVLLFGIVIAGSTMIFVSGTAVTEDVREQSRTDTAASAFAELDSNVQSLAQKRGSNREAVALGAVDPNDAEIRDTGEIRIRVNGNSACTATLDLSALEYSDADGTTLAYEGGAIWKQTKAGLITQKSPELGYHQGSLQLQVVRIDGAVADDDLSIEYDRSASERVTRGVHQDLFAESSCRRPTQLSVSVTSDYHEGWQRHLERSLPDTATVTETGPRTVTAELPIDADYDVIDFEGAGPGTVVDPGSGDDHFVLGPGPAGYDASSVTDGDGPDYAGTVTYLGGEHAAVGTDTVAENEAVRQAITVEYTETVDVDVTGTALVEVTNREWRWNNTTENLPPLEVSFVLDESGSMARYVDGSYGTKLDKARAATRTFLDVLDESERHRVSLLGYDRGYGSPTLYQPFTENQRRLDAQLRRLSASGGTDIPSAIEASAFQFRTDGADGHNKVMVVLTDGRDGSGRDPAAVARRVIPDDVTVYTIGVGDDVNDRVLRQVAAAGDSESRYISVADPTELDGVFEEIAKDETTNPNKEWSNETELVRVPLSAVGEDSVTVSRTIPPATDVWPGDTVTVSGTATASDEFTEERTVTVHRTVSGPNGTTAIDVTETVDVEFSGRREASVEGEVAVPESRTEVVEREREIPVVTYPSLSLSLSNGTDTVDLWGGSNVNAFAGGVEPGAYTNFWGDEAAAIAFSPLVRSCTDHSRTGETVEHGGTAYAGTTCSSYGSGSAGSTTVHLFANQSEIGVPASADWQSDLTGLLSVDGTQYYRYDDGDLQAWNLDSNQLLVLVEAPDSGGRDANNAVLLVEVGQSTTESSGEHLVNVQVTSVSARTGSADADDDDD